ncbi:hypothetical protein JQ599_24705 [Bradyrhizobium diazoefficiens]|nr:hypothetical protein [Bradyrhizobium diazoefficiens]MBR0703125.1 hypothetical protein [Bradyrhizobium diazoefficiens]MBR0771880.1 hypothetical protein [Bradyrhizobium diazoefficiens]
MKITIIEGTPAELEALPQFKTLITGAQAPIVKPGAPEDISPDASSSEEDDSPVSAELVKRALLRIPIPENQKAVIGVLFHTRDWISVRDLAGKAGVEEKSLGGIIGGLGLRLSGTRGWPRKYHSRPSRLLIDKEKHDGVIHYRAKDVFRQGVELAHIFNKNGR